MSTDLTCSVCWHGIMLHDVIGPCLGCLAEDERRPCGMTPADIAVTAMASTSLPAECDTCGGSGHARHPRWGSSTCPDDLVTCPTCDGRQVA